MDYDAVMAWLDPRVEKLPDAPGCWLWRGSRTPGGYPQVTMRALAPAPLGGHRVVYRWLFGDPGALHVLHTCATPPCVRPAHLYLGTRSMNMRERTAQGRCRRLSSHARASVYRATIEAGAEPAQVALDHGVSSRHVYRVLAGRVKWAEMANVNGGPR